ncbi:MAG: bifunctional hydroxymethylpyrimidine kinase/phosphomethylpyrimidine kinase [Rhodoferax sp.]|uniref:bifunctional hydroxymethylpyrimidine kinase/phosphomethylpyrimidine kinase n=1 Tax=Rhodoferax sp. TaxID=50421 RepID=UPI0026332D2B|nr:bifunctional hydroxymethylpyrimidine kinase/phosphomethylpyrimidine kinase [Rhodoferax sp.]MDD2880191.1 bifunctional hydroxymethylpyrimidine kinase/phosphomethylpyrimidine kinase [Rhodoferax sp.]
MLPHSLTPDTDTPDTPAGPACILVFNSNDPSGAGGLAADVGAIASVGAHALPVVAGVYARDTAHIFDFFPMDDEAVGEQARAVLEDIEVQAIKLGFVGTPDNLGVVAGISADYPDVPLIAHMPDLSWWTVDQIEAYHEAFSDLILPQTSVLTGNHSTLWRWLLPAWSGERNPTARDIAVAAGEHGANFTLVTGISTIDGQIENTLAAPHSVVASEKFPRQERAFTGAGDTLSAALAALLASDSELPQAFSEALSYLDRALAGGFRPGMGSHMPDRLFWAQPEDTAAAAEIEARTEPDNAIQQGENSSPSIQSPEPNTHDTPH